MNRSSLGLTACALAGSFVLHGAAYAALPPNVPVMESVGPSQVTVEIPPPRAPRGRAVEPPPPEPEPLRPAPTARPVALPEPVRAPEPSRAPIDLRGVTLTDGDGAFASSVGDGSRLDGPIRAPTAPAPTAPPVVAAAAVTPRAVPAVVPVADLSARPEPPALDAALRANYPADAERQGLGGSSQVRARIDPDGRVHNLAVLAESHPGFGEACRRTLAASRWSAPRDRDGRAVATEIRYTCRFVVAR
jgi:TonB family protein